jgi:hypothetical protein
MRLLRSFALNAAAAAAAAAARLGGEAIDATTLVFNAVAATHFVVWRSKSSVGVARPVGCGLDKFWRCSPTLPVGWTKFPYQSAPQF